MSQPDVEFERGLPASVDAERTILGGILLDNESYAQTGGHIEAEDFALDSHQRIFRRMEELLARGRPVDLVTLAEELSKRKETGFIGGVAYISSLIEGLPRRLSIESYVHIVKQKSLLRQAINSASRLITQAADQSEDAGDIIHEFRETAEMLAEKSTERALETFGDFVKKNYPNIDTLYQQNAMLEGARTGLEEFDELTCGFQNGDLCFLAARPSMGKTALAVQIILNQAIRMRKTIAMFSLEMTKRQILDRALSCESGVAFDDIRKGKLNASRMGALTDALDDITHCSLHIDDTPGQTVAQMRSKAALLKQQAGLDEVVIDQLSHIELPPALVRNMNREQQVSKICKQLKHMARALRVPVVALHQLNRDSLKKQDKRPTLGDLRESGSIEQDADLVAFIHRESYYDRGNTSIVNDAELIIAKQRQGPTETVNLYVDLPRQRFKNHPNWESGGRQKEMY